MINSRDRMQERFTAPVSDLFCILYFPTGKKEICVEIVFV